MNKQKIIKMLKAFSSNRLIKLRQKINSHPKVIGTQTQDWYNDIIKCELDKRKKHL